MPYYSQLRNSHLVKIRRVLAVAVLLKHERPGVPPSVREIAARTGFGVATVHRCLHELRDHYGYVAFDDRGRRDLQITEQY